MSKVGNRGGNGGGGNGGGGFGNGGFGNGGFGNGGFGGGGFAGPVSQPASFDPGPAPAPVQVATANFAPLPGRLSAGSRPAIASGSFVNVSFLQTITSGDITRFLQAYNATIVAGPNADGVYRLRVTDATMPASRLQEVVDSMRSQTEMVQSVDL